MSSPTSSPTSSDPLMALTTQLTRIAHALEAMAPTPATQTSPEDHDAYVWEARQGALRPVAQIARIPLRFLCGIETVMTQLMDNTRRFSDGYAANNALLWGARGMGKSSAIKAIHREINLEKPGALVLVEIHREDIPTLPQLLAILRTSRRRFLLFCDDLSFDEMDQSYKNLKALLEGGLEGRPDNVLFYATSNRRHLLERHMIENEQSTAIHPAEAVEEKVSLSDRFGLWLGFHACSQDVFFHMIRQYVQALEIPITDDALIAEARAWQVTRGSRSGRVAWQFVQDLAGRHGRTMDTITGV